MGGRESIRLTLVLAVVGLAGAATVAGLELVSGDSLGELPLLLLVVLYVGLLVGLTTTIRRMSHEAEEIEHMALYDSLTELPNRILFQDVVERAMSMAERQGTTAAVLLMDLDRFKEINDTLGHHNGDLLLHVIATRLRRALRSSDTVARLGGDEFAVLVPNVRGHSGAREVADKVRATVAERCVVGGVSLEVEASVGMALYPRDATDPETLLRHADVAMYEAKAARSGYEIYSAERDENSVARLELISQLRQAIDRDELLLHFQPKADLRSGRVVGVEALVRWEHPTDGLLYPDQFVKLAEVTGLIRAMTQWVLERALRQCRAWRDAGLDLTVAVNLSPRNLIDIDLPDRVQALLDEVGLAPSSLELEITESMIMTDPPRATAVLTRLDAMGVALAIDDFGTGYSSMTWLRQLPVTSLKIDKSFVLSMDRREHDSVIVRSTVQLGRNLGLRVIAEGVEDGETWDELCALGCDEAQGFLLSRPTPPEMLTPWLLDRQETQASGCVAAPMPAATEAGPAPPKRRPGDQRADSADAASAAAR